MWPCSSSTNAARKGVRSSSSRRTTGGFLSHGEKTMEKQLDFDGNIARKTRNLMGNFRENSDFLKEHQNSFRHCPRNKLNHSCFISNIPHWLWVSFLSKNRLYLWDSFYWNALNIPAEWISLDFWRDSTPMFTDYHDAHDLQRILHPFYCHQDKTCHPSQYVDEFRWFGGPRIISIVF